MDASFFAPFPASSTRALEPWITSWVREPLNSGALREGEAVGDGVFSGRPIPAFPMILGLDFEGSLGGCAGILTFIV